MSYASHHEKYNPLLHIVTILLLSVIIQPDEERDHVEVSPISGMIVQDIATAVSTHGGFALLADYGHDGTKEDTFRVSVNVHSLF